MEVKIGGKLDKHIAQLWTIGIMQHIFQSEGEIMKQQCCKSETVVGQLAIGV